MGERDELAAATPRSSGPTAMGVAALAVIAAIMRAGRPVLNTPDSFWHWDLGRRIVTDGLPTHDPYSFVTPGQSWVLNQWGTESVFGVVDRLGGLWLVALVTAVLTGATVWLAGREMLRRAPGLTTVGVTGLVLLAVQPAMSLRGSLFTMLFLPVLLQLLDRDRPSTLVAGVLFLVWANLHAGFLLGIALIVIERTGRLLRASSGHRRPILAHAIALLGVGLAASLATPYGPRLFASGLSLIPRGADAQIVEWGPTRVTSPLALAFTAIVIIVVVSLGIAATRADLPDILLVVAVVLFGYSAVRNVPPAAVVVAIVGAPYVQTAVAALFGTTVHRRVAPNRLETTVVIGVLLVGLLTAATIPPRTSLVAAHTTDIPLALMDQLDQLDRDVRVVVPSGWAPAVATLTGSHVRTGVDGRLELFTDEELEAQWRVERGAPDANEILDDWCATDVLAPTGSDMHAHVDDDPRWARRGTAPTSRNDTVAEWFSYQGNKRVCPPVTGSAQPRSAGSRGTRQGSGA